MLDGRIARLTNTQSEFGARVRQPGRRRVVRRGAGAARLPLGARARAARGLAGRVPVPRLRRAAPRALQRAAQRRGRPLLRRACRSRPAPRSSPRWCSCCPSRARSAGRRVAMVALVVALGFLMVSTFRYRSFKGIDLRRRRSYISVLGIALLFLIVASQPEASLLAATGLYTLSGPVAWAYGALRRRPDPRPPLTSTSPSRAREPQRPGGGRGRRRDPRRQGAADPPRQAAALRPLGGAGRNGRARRAARAGARARDAGGDRARRRARSSC